jgi:hypothetical protein
VSGFKKQSSSTVTYARKNQGKIVKRLESFLGKQTASRGDSLGATMEVRLETGFSTVIGAEGL